MENNISYMTLIAGGVGIFCYYLYNKRFKCKMYEEMSNILETTTFIKDKIQELNINPKIGIILGSGQIDVIKNFEKCLEIPYNDIPNFPISTVKGHNSKIIFGKIFGLDICVMAGRFHFYEGYSSKQVGYPIRIMKQLGVKDLIITNSSGGINKSYNVGDIIIVKDHIYFPGLCGFNPLVGKNNDVLGSRFVATNNIYTSKYRKTIMNIAKDNEMNNVKEGVYFCVSGPTYETPSEINLMRLCGGDLVGMSSIPEVITACHSDMNILLLGIITNKCIDYTDSDIIPSHEEVCVNAGKSIGDMSYLINTFLKQTFV